MQIGSHSFTFDHVFGSAGTPLPALFEKCVSPLVEGLFHGYNATVLAYGQVRIAFASIFSSAQKRPLQSRIQCVGILISGSHPGLSIAVVFTKICFISKCCEKRESKLIAKLQQHSCLTIIIGHGYGDAG